MALKKLKKKITNLLSDPFGPDSIAEPWPTAKELTKKDSSFHKAVKKFYANQQKDSSKNKTS